MQVTNQMLKARIRNLEAQGAKVLLAYDYSKGGMPKIIAGLAKRKTGLDVLQDVVMDVLNYDLGDDTVKVRYLLVAVKAEAVIKEEKVKKLFGHEEVTILEKLVPEVKEKLVKLGIHPVDNKLAGVQLITSYSI